MALAFRKTPGARPVFAQYGARGSAVTAWVVGVAAVFLALTTAGARAEPIPEACKQGGFAIGCQAYSFNRFTVFEAIERTAAAGAKVIEFYPDQRLSKEEPAVRWNHNASEETIAKVQAKLKEHGLKAVNYGVVGGRDAAEWRKIFEFAKKLGLYAITTEDVSKLDIIEPLVKEFDIRIAFHDHPRRANNPDYRMWDPWYLVEVTKGRDPRIGACADTGHWQTSGLNPVYCLRVLNGRIISSHLKDKTDYGPGHDVPYGRGVGEIQRCLEELKKQGFEGNISVEYEYNFQDNVADVKQCIDFVRAYGK
jgi:sugar phosphate isomerase/epimerase